eukprot:scaffold10449_cov131-Skeletonema_dohrnii-CCMP3373.AAC.2
MHTKAASSQSSFYQISFLMPRRLRRLYSFVSGVVPTALSIMFVGVPKRTFKGKRSYNTGSR